MKLLFCLLLWVGFYSSGLAVEPTENREWTATGGHKVMAVATAVKGDVVVLKKESGKLLKVPLKKFIPADQEFLTKHFKVGEVADSGTAAATGLPHPQGEVVGPIETPEGSHYLLYLPKSLKEGRKAPLLFYTGSGGGNKGLLKRITEGAETCGYVMAMSVESQNGKDNTEECHTHCKNALNHIIDTLPVDGDRVYFTGNSGGGAMAFYNASKMKCEGVMPNVAYIPGGSEPKAHVYFVIGGGKDYNRYSSAAARAKFGKKAVHRMHPGGHGVSPDWLMIDGMIWFQGRYLAKNKKSCADEIKDFDIAMLKWLETKKSTESYRAYATARFLMEEYEMGGSAKEKLQKLLTELAGDPSNVLYYEGLQDIDKFSLKELAKFGAGSKMKHLDPKIEKAANKLLKKYVGVPVIEDTIKAIASKTG